MKLVGTKSYRYCWLMLLVLFASNFETAQALDLDVRSNKTNRLDFSLIIDRATIDVDDGVSDLQLNLTRIGIESIDVPLKGPQFGLLLGYAYADFSNHVNIETVEMDGYYIGVSVRGYLLQGQDAALSLSGHYIYQSVDGKDDQAAATLSWDELSANLKLTVRLGTSSALFVGYNSAIIDARYRYDGATNSNIDLENTTEHGALIGFVYQIERLETVGIRYQQSAMEGIALQFRKIF